MNKLKELCLEITNACTMECLHCSTCSVGAADKQSVHMPIERVKALIDELKDLGGTIFEISGGEPFLHPDLFEIIRYAASSGLEVRLYTSGIIQRDKNSLSGIDEALAKRLLAEGVSRIIFNIEGAAPAAHERIIGVCGAFNVLMESVRNVKSAGLWTGVHFVPMLPNYNEFSGVMRLCHSLGVDELALLRFVPQGRGEKNKKQLELSLDQFDYFLREVANTRNRYPGLDVRVGCPLDFLSLYDKTVKPHICKAGKCTCAISPEGNVVPCPAFKNTAAFIAGNIHRDTLNNIWQNGFVDLRNFRFDEIQGECNSCEYLGCCHGRCAAQRYLASGNIAIGPDPYCPVSLINANANETLIAANG